jgi:hypothetical protein
MRAGRHQHRALAQVGLYCWQAPLIDTALQSMLTGRTGFIQLSLHGVPVQVHFRPSSKEGPTCMLGPVRFRQHLSPRAGEVAQGRAPSPVTPY